MQKQFVSVHLLDQLLAAIMLQAAKRSARGNASCRKQRIERSGKRADVVGSGLRHLSDHVHADGAQARERDVGRNVAELSTQNFLYRVLHFTQSPSAHQQRSGLRQG